MGKGVKSMIEQFIADIKTDYPDLYIDYDYDEENDEYEIWHNDPNLEYNDARFKRIVGIKAEKWLFDNDIFNFCFTYDHSKVKKLIKYISSITMKPGINSILLPHMKINLERIIKDI